MSCKYGKKWPGFQCDYKGPLLVPTECNEDWECPAYEEVKPPDVYPTTKRPRRAAFLDECAG
jgi:hypothetical protein